MQPPEQVAVFQDIPSVWNYQSNQPSHPGLSIARWQGREYLWLVTSAAGKEKLAKKPGVFALKPASTENKKLTVDSLLKVYWTFSLPSEDMAVQSKDKFYISKTKFDKEKEIANYNFTLSDLKDMWKSGLTAQNVPEMMDYSQKKTNKKNRNLIPDLRGQLVACDGVEGTYIVVSTSHFVKVNTDATIWEVETEGRKVKRLLDQVFTVPISWLVYKEDKEDAGAVSALISNRIHTLFNPELTVVKPWCKKLNN